MKIQKPGYEIQVRPESLRGNASVFLNDRVLDEAGQEGIKHVSARIYNEDGFSKDVTLPHRHAIGTGHVFAADLLLTELEAAGKDGKVQLVMSVEKDGGRTESALGPALKVTDFLLGRARTGAKAK